MAATMIGILSVARCAACPAGVAPATMMSILEATSSFASRGSCSILPSAVRGSMM
jgi:hypothetical protein